MQLLLNYLKLANLAEQAIASRQQAERRAVDGKKIKQRSVTARLILASMVDRHGRQLDSSLLNATRLAANLGCPRARVSAQVKELVDMELLSEARSDQDGRQTLLTLTESGFDAAVSDYQMLETLDSTLRQHAGILRRRTADADALAILSALEELV